MSERSRIGGRLRNLEARARLLAAVRAFFARRGFVEIEAPVRVRAPALEVHIDAVPADEGWWLITSPEFQMKRLLAAGMPRIYTVCKCFRAGERGSHHEVEFTMLEWYRAPGDLEEIIEDTEQLVAEAVAAVAGGPMVTVAGKPLDLRPPWDRLTVAEAMQRHAGMALRGDMSAAELRAALTAAGIDPGTAVAWDDLFFTAFVDRVEPALAAADRPLLLTDWPAPLAALARRKPGDPTVVDRFEAFIGGLELANAFGELTDPVEQRARFEEDQRVRRERGKPVHPIDEHLIAALEEGLPPSAGIALGIDRLAMIACGADHIRDVLPFTGDEL